jgi:hypothetical protein
MGGTIAARAGNDGRGTRISLTLPRRDLPADRINPAAA